jgi:hypothetical protein
MTTLFRYVTLNRIGAGLFAVSVLLVVGGAINLIIQAVAGGSGSNWLAAPNVGPFLLAGLLGMVLSAIIFALAITQERLARIEAKLDTVMRARAPGPSSGNDRADPVAAAGGPRE